MLKPNKSQILTYEKTILTDMLVPYWLVVI
jgi:hypothetical protein